MSSLPPPAPLEEQPSYELLIEKTGWRKALVWLGTVRGALLILTLIVLLVAGWNARTLYRAVKLWRAERLIARFEEASRSGDEAAQTRYLRQAFALLPSDPLTWRALAHYHEQRGEGAALAAYEHLLTTGKATTDDATRACRMAALRGDPATTRKILESVQNDERVRDLPAARALRARQLAFEGSWPSALTLAEQAAGQSPDSGPEKLLLASLLLQSADRAPAEQRLVPAQRAVGLLAELATQPDDTGVDALTTLMSLARQPAAAQLLAGHSVPTWIEAAERHPKAGARVRILAWNLRLASKAVDPDEFFSDFLEKWRNADLAQRLEAARWLNQNGRPGMALELSTPQKDMSEDWFFVFLDALAATGQWEAVLEHLSAKSGQAAKMPGALRALFQFRARSELRQPIDAEEIWRDIQIQLQSEPTRNQLYIAQYAEKTGAMKQAATIYRRLLQESSTSATFDRALAQDAKFACYSGLIRSIPATAPATEVLPWMEGITADFPDLEEARNDALYLRLLTSAATNDQMRDTLSDLLGRKPSLLAYRTTAVLYELRRGNAAGAVKLYAGWKIDWTTAADRFKAIKVAALTAAGQKSEAAELLATINRRALRPEEVALLDPK